MARQSNIRSLAGQLCRGETTCEQLICERMDLARKTSGVFVRLDQDAVLQQATAIDRQSVAGKLPPLAGVPVTLKDLFNVRGEKTLAGSIVLAGKAETQSEDAEVVAYLRAAGMLFLGRTVMSEFAFSGIGLNPHVPPLYSVWDQAGRRVPGGSSSGSAISVAMGIVPGTLGSDTAGSCRLPAAFNGIVGMKPSCGRLSLKGVYPLSPSSDAAGPMAVDVDSCFLLDQLMQGNVFSEMPELKPVDPRELRFLIPEGVVMEALDAEVESAFNSAVDRLQAAGVEVLRQPLTVVDDSVDMFLKRNIVNHEAWQHQPPRHI